MFFGQSLIRLQNIELFFCLYANQWGNPAQCNSSNSRLLGFFSTLPGIWRAVQCFRRYHDTGNAFPHLLNLGKYMATIIFYMTLSIYRIDKTTPHRAVFITFATVNSVYTSFWDVYYDWSLGDPSAKHPFLRQTLGYKKIWMYYVAMVIDPILRFNWILYAVIPLQLQHSAVTSFFVAFSEIFRRGMWSLFRVENEHCSNVGHFRASRDVALPYDMSSPSLNSEGDVRQDYSRRPHDEEAPLSPHVSRSSTVPQEAYASGADANLPSAALRRRASDGQQPSPMARGLQRMGTALRTAHNQDFEKKKKPELGASTVKDYDSDDDEEDGDGDEDEDESGEASESASRAGDSDDREDIVRVREDMRVGRPGPAR